MVVIRLQSLSHLRHVTFLRDNRLAIELKATAERRDIDIAKALISLLYRVRSYFSLGHRCGSCYIPHLSCLKSSHDGGDCTSHTLVFSAVLLPIAHIFLCTFQPLIEGAATYCSAQLPRAWLLFLRWRRIPCNSLLSLTL